MATNALPKFRKPVDLTIVNETSNKLDSLCAYHHPFGIADNDREDNPDYDRFPHFFQDKVLVVSKQMWNDALINVEMFGPYQDEGLLLHHRLEWLHQMPRHELNCHTVYKNGFQQSLLSAMYVVGPTDVVCRLVNEAFDAVIAYIQDRSKPLLLNGVKLINFRIPIHIPNIEDYIANMNKDKFLCQVVMTMIVEDNIVVLPGNILALQSQDLMQQEGLDGRSYWETVAETLPTTNTITFYYQRKPLKTKPLLT